MKIGRNEPCYCGSGKKYKHCHLAQDEKRKPAPPETSEDAESPSAPLGPAQISSLMRQVARIGSKKEQAKFGRLAAQLQPILAYLERREEIESASTALEAHREELTRLTDNEEAYLSRARALFAEDHFAPMRFTAADIRRAFEKVGYPAHASSDGRFVEKLRAAILDLADKDRRSQLAMNLLLHLPHYVTAGRYLDGWLIQHCAYLTVEDAEESNPFLFQMFSHGYDAWADEQNARDEALLREIGMDPARLRSMSMEEIDEWLQAQQSDSDRKARMEAVLMANPEQRAQAVAGLEKMERDSIKMLEREDARELLLPQAEIDPCVPILLQRFESAQKASPDLSADTPPDDAESTVFADAIWPAFGEMAQSIFTSERIQQLVAQLRKYRNERFAAGDKDVAGWAIGAITSLERENAPAQNYFLNALCLVSLRTLLGAMGNASAQNFDAAPRESFEPPL